MASPSPRPTPRVSGAGKARGGAQLFHTGYSYEGLDTAAWASGPWQRPSVTRAEEVRVEQLVQRGQAPIWGTTLSDLEPLGPGVPLYFSLLRHLGCFFVFACVLTVPILLLSNAGDGLRTVSLATEIDALHTAFLSIANIGLPTTSADEATLVPLSMRPSLTFSRRHASLVIMGVDLAMALTFLVFTLVLRCGLAASSDRVRRHVPKASDFAVYVTGLPANAADDEIRDHFSTLYNLRAPDWTFPSSCGRCCWSGRKTRERRRFADPSASLAAPRAASSRRRNAAAVVQILDDEDVGPVRDARNTGNPAYLGSWVAEVTVATANGGLIVRYQALAGLFQRLRIARARVKKFSEGSEFADPKRRARATAALDRIERSVDKINAAYGQKWSGACVGAFVVFNNEESRRRCIDDYRKFSFLQATPLRFRGRNTLTIHPAPDPSQVVWENLELSAFSRWRRRSLVNALVLFLLAISTVVIIGAQSQEARFALSASTARMCGTTLPAVAFNVSLAADGSVAPGASFPSGTLQLNYAAHPSVCPPKSSRFYFKDVSGRARTVTTPNASGCLSECWPDSSQDPGSTLSCFQPTISRGVLLRIPITDFGACYCRQVLSQLVYDQGPLPGTFALARDPVASVLCAKAATTYLTAHVITIFVSLVVGIINFALRALIVRLVRMEGHRSVAEQQRAVEVKLFLSMFVNTSLLVLLVNSALSSIVGNVNLAGQPVLVGQETGFSVSWHVTVGASVVLTMILTNFYSHAMTLWLLICACPALRRCKSRRAGAGTVTQAELNAKFIPPPFELPARLAVLLNVVFSCLMYAAGNAVLLCIAAGSIILTYAIDKAALLRLYGRPAHYASSIVEVAVEMLPWAGLLHMALAIWMYSEPSVMYSPSLFGAGDTSFLGASLAGTTDRIAAGAQQGDTSSWRVVSRITQENTFPIFFTLAAIVAVLVFRWTVWFVLAQAAQWGSRLCCQCCAPDDEAQTAARQGCCARGCGSRRNALYGRSPFCGPFEQVLPSGEEPRLSSYESAQGWRVVRDRRSRLLKICTPAASGGSGGATDWSTQLLTWEVLQQHGIASYDPLANPLYAEAVRSLEAARLQVLGQGDAMGVSVKARLRRAGRAASVRARLRAPPPGTSTGVAETATLAATVDVGLAESELPMPLPPGAFELRGMEYAAAGFQLWDEPRVHSGDGDFDFNDAALRLQSPEHTGGESTYARYEAINARVDAAPAGLPGHLDPSHAYGIGVTNDGFGVDLGVRSAWGSMRSLFPMHAPPFRTDPQHAQHDSSAYPPPYGRRPHDEFDAMGQPTSFVNPMLPVVSTHAGGLSTWASPAAREAAASYQFVPVHGTDPGSVLPAPLRQRRPLSPAEQLASEQHPVGIWGAAMGTPYPLRSAPEQHVLAHAYPATLPPPTNPAFGASQVIPSWAVGSSRNLPLFSVSNDGHYRVHSASSYDLSGGVAGSTRNLGQSDRVRSASAQHLPGPHY